MSATDEDQRVREERSGKLIVFNGQRSVLTEGRTFTPGQSPLDRWPRKITPGAIPPSTAGSIKAERHV